MSIGNTATYESTIQKLHFGDKNVGHFFPFKLSLFSIYHKIYLGDSKHIDYILKLRLHIKNCFTFYLLTYVSSLMKVLFSITFQTTGLQVDFETLFSQKQYYVLVTESPG